MEPGTEVSVSNLSALFGASAVAADRERNAPPPTVTTSFGKESDAEVDQDQEDEEKQLKTAFSAPNSRRRIAREVSMSAQPSPPPPLRPPRCYGDRAVGGWRPQINADFGDGGAFPEVHVVQLPRGLGWGATGAGDGASGRASSFSSPQSNADADADANANHPPASLDCSFDDLQTRAARVMLRLDDDDGAGEGRETNHRSRLRSSSSSSSRAQRMTAEYASFVRFVSGVLDQSQTRKLESDAVVAALLAAHPNARPVERVTDLDPAIVGETYLRSGGASREDFAQDAAAEGKEKGNPAASGTPVVVSDGAKGWERGMAWGLEGLAKHYGGCVVRCNDRAPARHADAREPGMEQLGREWEREREREREQERERERERERGGEWRLETERAGRREGSFAAGSPLRDSPPPRWGGTQQSCALHMREFIRYVMNRPGCDDPAGLRTADAPFYCNGWRAFELKPRGKNNGDDCDNASVDDALTTTAAAFPPPYFTALVDHTRDITRQTHRALLPNAPPAVAEAVVESLDTTLSKIFAGPAGTVTRLHQDAGDAHAWLGQARGRKLFVCYPPDDAPNLYLIEGEAETVQSAVDPLAARRSSVAGAADDQPLYWASARPVVFVLEPGEVALVPRGWWHYAAALDSSVTVMRNFYHAGTNAEALVKTIIAKAKGTVMCCG